jgi:hypothetical protein
MSKVETDLPAVTGTPTPPSAADPLREPRKEASAALFALAFLQFCSLLLVTVVPLVLSATVEPRAQAVAIALTGLPGLVFVALGVWARYTPLPAAAVGLALLLVLMVMTVVAAPSEVSLGGVVRLLVGLVLVAVLARAIRACWLVRSGRAGTTA